MNFKKMFSQQDLSEIEQAVKNAESKTSGEIVTFIAHCSDVYEETVWEFGFFGFFINLIVFSYLKQYFNILENTKVFLGMILVITFLFVVCLKLFPHLRAVLTVYDKKKKRTMQAAKEKFLTEEVFCTRERTGILIYISLLEKRVEIIGDSGINAKVDQSQWQAIADVIVNGMKKHTYKQSIIQAIEMCGNLLESSNVERRADDTNELSDAVRFDVK